MERVGLLAVIGIRARTEIELDTVLATQPDAICRPACECASGQSAPARARLRIRVRRRPPVRIGSLVKHPPGNAHRQTLVTGW